MKSKIALFSLIAAISIVTARAGTITPGFTFTVADDFIGASFVGTHYHSNTGGSFGNPAGMAEVGGFFGTEEPRGLSEYDLTGLAISPSAFVTFKVAKLDGLFGQGFGAFGIDINAYTGNNTENLGDYEAASLGFVGNFGTGGLAVGDTLSFDITTLYNGLIGNSTSLGIRLQQSVRNIQGGAITFNDFRLTTENQSTNVPDASSTFLLLGLGCIGLLVARRSWAVC